MEFKHKSVLLEETIDSLNIKPDGIYLDGTLGGGGHSSEVCKRLGEKGRLIGIDHVADYLPVSVPSEILCSRSDHRRSKGIR